MRRRRFHWGPALVLSVALVALAAAPSPARAGDASVVEQEAFAFRRLQSELMVAALSCKDPRYSAHYNTFVTRFRPALADNARVLRTYFRRLHGPMAMRHLDDFMTRLANEASLMSMGDAQFCVNALARFEVINYAEQDQTAGRLVEEAELVIDQ